MGTKFNEYLAEQLKDPEFRREYEALQPEHAVIQAMIDASAASFSSFSWHSLFSIITNGILCILSE